MAKRVIITGANGFIGSKTVEIFLKHDWTVLALDVTVHPSRLDLTNPNLTYVRWDMLFGGVEDMRLEEYMPDTWGNEPYDVFIHFAWSGSSGIERESLRPQMKNVYATAKCVDLAKQFGCSKFVGAGSLMEYEIANATHYDGVLTSINHYGVAKLAAHYLAKQTAQELDIDFVWGIITNIYGPGETSKRFINNVLHNVVEGKPLTFNTTCEQLYDFVYIDDGANAFYQLACGGRNNKEYIITSGNARPLREWVWDIADLYNTAEPSFSSTLVDCALPWTIFSNRGMSSIGWSPQISFEEGIKRTKEWIENNEEIYIL